MTLICIVCSSDSPKYKCSTCYSSYCSLDCWKSHKKDDNCKKAEFKNDTVNVQKVKEKSLVTEDTVPVEKLLMLGSNTHLKKIVSIPALQEVLTAIDNSTDPSESIQRAMQDPLFAEFVDTCLTIVEEESGNNDFF